MTDALTWLSKKREAWTQAMERHQQAYAEMRAAAENAATAQHAEMYLTMADRHQNSALDRLTDVENASALLDAIHASAP